MYKKDFKIKRGETFNKDIYFKSNNEPFDLTGYTAKSQIRPSAESNQLLAEIICNVIPEEGIVNMYLTKDQTMLIPAGIYYYDLCLTKNIDNYYYLEGKFIIDKRVTEPDNV